MGVGRGPAAPRHGDGDDLLWLTAAVMPRGQPRALIRGIGLDAAARRHAFTRRCRSGALAARRAGCQHGAAVRRPRSAPAPRRRRAGEACGSGVQAMCHLRHAKDGGNPGSPTRVRRAVRRIRRRPVQRPSGRRGSPMPGTRQRARASSPRRSTARRCPATLAARRCASSMQALTTPRYELPAMTSPVKTRICDWIRPSRAGRGILRGRPEILPTWRRQGRATVSSVLPSCLGDGREPAALFVFSRNLTESQGSRAGPGFAIERDVPWHCFRLRPNRARRRTARCPVGSVDIE